MSIFPKAEETLGFYAIFACCTFFIWMDLSFFGEMHDQGVFVKNGSEDVEVMFPVKSVKLRMQDHISHYIHLPLCEYFNERFEFYKVPGVSPNLISFSHLVIGLISMRFFLDESLVMRRIGCLLYELRSGIDILDGVVYRSQSHMKNTFVSVHGSYGYLIDAAADFIAGFSLLFVTIYIFNQNPPVKRTRPKQDVEIALKLGLNNDVMKEEEKEHYTRRYVNIVLFFHAIQVILRSYLWDVIVKEYHEVLETPKYGIPQEMQAEVLQFRSTWVIMWLWKISSADAFIQYTLFAIFFNKLWEWIHVSTYVGAPQLAALVVLTQLHMMEVKAYLGVS